MYPAYVPAVDVHEDTATDAVTTSEDLREGTEDISPVCGATDAHRARPPHQADAAGIAAGAGARAAVLASAAAGARARGGDAGGLASSRRGGGGHSRVSWV